MHLGYLPVPHPILTVSTPTPPTHSCSPGPYRSRFLSVTTSRFMDSLDSVMSSSSRCSRLRPAWARDASSSASSTCLFSCFIRRFPFSNLRGPGEWSHPSGVDFTPQRGAQTFLPIYLPSLGLSTTSDIFLT